ncbi:hypothetical protein A1D23_10500 [Chelonobacter oris]|uniref:DUF1294 domain-containing protein n=1 Tax=Chelonobacter oris TaxID=505317 RepID=UPI00244B6DFA|nr:DUF1294 domain-containing protein [Chelonobacter oris]MDH3000886.1 hypothetical protein [Chelonobacter oris]
MLDWIFVGLYLAAINIAAYFLMYIDKRRAVKKQWRIAEKRLLMCCIGGGFIGVALALIGFQR